MDLTVKIGRLTLKNPVTVASGTAGYGEELSHYIDIGALGAIFTKGLSLKPREGNKGNRVIETPSGMLNSIGLENVGLEKFLNEKLPYLFSKKATVIPNVAGHSVEENVELCKTLSHTKGIDAVELNVSCPNVKQGGMAFGTDMRMFINLLEKVRSQTSCSLIVKLSPNVTTIAEFAAMAEKLGADAISAVNTFLGMKIDTETMKPYFNNVFAGLSGPAMKPLAVRAVYQIYKRVTIPIIGMGGIACLADMLEFLFAGASAVSVGTMNMIHPHISIDVIAGLTEYMKTKKMKSMGTLVGAAHESRSSK